MKQLFFLIALMSATQLMAQTKSDTSQVNPKAPPHEEKSFPVKNMVQVKHGDIPAGLKKTLSSAQYKGWEKGALYYDKKTKEYALTLADTTQEALKDNKEITGKITPKHTGWYYFTADGKPIDN